MFNKIVAMLVMACALLMGAPAWAQAPVGIEKTHRASENVGTLWETCVHLFTPQKATAKCWMNTLRLKADGTLERADPKKVKAGEILYFGIPTPVLKEEAQKTLGGAQVHSNTVGTTDNAKAGVVPAPAKPQASQDTALEAMKPQSNVLPETNALAPLAAPSAPTLTEDLVFKTPEQINPETGISVPVISGAAEVSSSDKFLENFLRTSLFSVILILTIISMFMGAEYRNDLGYFSKLSSISRKTTLKVVDSREELEAMSKKFYAQSAQASKARKPRTDLTAPIKRLVANGGQIATDFGKKASSFFARPGVKTQKAKKEKWAGRSKSDKKPKKMLLLGKKTPKAYTPPVELAKANTAWNPDTPEAIKENGALHQQLFGGEQKAKEVSTPKSAHLTVVPKTSTLVVAATPPNRLRVTVKEDFAQSSEKRVLFLEVENVNGVPHFFWPDKGLVKYTRAGVACMLKAWEGQEHYKVFLKPLELEKSKAELNHDPELLIEGTLPGPESVRIRLEPAMASA